MLLVSSMKGLQHTLHPREKLYLYRLGVGVGSLSVWDLNVATRPKIMASIAAVCIEACTIFRWPLQIAPHLRTGELQEA